MQKFTVGQQVMVKDRYGVASHPTYTLHEVLGFYRKNPGWSTYSRRAPEFIEDPTGNYVRVARPTREFDCNGCANTGQVEPYWDIVDDMYQRLTVCPNCQGKGKIVSSSNYHETILNRKDYIMSLEDYQPILDAAKARIKRDEEYKKAQQELVNNLVTDLVNVVLDADDKVIAAAEFISKYAYATQYTPAGRTSYGYVKQSPLYEAAAKVREERRKAVAV